MGINMQNMNNRARMPLTRSANVVVMTVRSGKAWLRCSTRIL